MSKINCTLKITIGTSLKGLHKYTSATNVSVTQRMPYLTRMPSLQSFSMLQHVHTNTLELFTVKITTDKIQSM